MIEHPDLAPHHAVGTQGRLSKVSPAFCRRHLYAAPWLLFPAAALPAAHGAGAPPAPHSCAAWPAPAAARSSAGRAAGTCQSTPLWLAPRQGRQASRWPNESARHLRHGAGGGNLGRWMWACGSGCVWGWEAQAQPWARPQAHQAASHPDPLSSAPGGRFRRCSSGRPCSSRGGSTTAVSCLPYTQPVSCARDRQGRGRGEGSTEPNSASQMLTLEKQGSCEFVDSSQGTLGKSEAT